jgi:hypothetical protein
MGPAIFFIVLIAVINIFMTKSFIGYAEGSVFDNKSFHRILLVPPLGILACAVFILFVVAVAVLSAVVDIWNK